MAGWSAELIDTQIALGGFGNGFPVLHRADELAGSIANLYQADRFVRAISGTRATTNARIVVDGDFASVKLSANGPGWALDHAHRILAMHARSGDHDIVVNRTLAQKTGIVVVGTCASAHAVVTTSTTV